MGIGLFALLACQRLQACKLVDRVAHGVADHGVVLLHRAVVLCCLRTQIGPQAT